MIETMIENVLDNLNTILKSKLPDNFSSIEIKQHFSLQQDLLINSILFYSLLMDIEKAFNIELKIVTMDAAEYSTVGSLANYITSLIEEVNYDN